MKLSNSLRLWTTALSGVICIGLLPAKLWANDPNNTQPKPDAGQRTFAAPDDAIKALQEATADKDKPALRELFGPEFDQLLTGDKTQDAKNAQKFAASVAEGCKAVPEGDDRMLLEIGTNQWPMPIPLVKADGQWHFDTEAGKEEIIARHIGKDELHAIGVCRAYVKAQQQYASQNSGGGDAVYAERLLSTPGKKDGLYWPADANGAPNAFMPMIAEQRSEGFIIHHTTTRPAYHGYYFRILTRQGPDATGGAKDYMSHGRLSGGFALVAYPENWDKSGIMTFMVGQDGTVYEKNLGEDTGHLARKIKEYNPDGSWKTAQDEGVWDTTVNK